MPSAILKLFTSKEVGQLLGIHPKLVERMAKRGDFAGLMVGRFWRYRASTAGDLRSKVDLVRRVWKKPK